MRTKAEAIADMKQVYNHLRVASEFEKLRTPGVRLGVGVIATLPDGRLKVISTMDAGEFLPDLGLLIEAPEFDAQALAQKIFDDPATPLMEQLGLMLGHVSDAIESELAKTNTAPEELVGAIRRMGPTGPVYEVVEMYPPRDGKIFFRIMIPETGEELDSSYEDILRDPPE